jgi:hypothetical protein
MPGLVPFDWLRGFLLFVAVRILTILAAEGWALAKRQVL